MKNTLKLKDLCRHLKVFPSQMYALEARGVLPNRPWGKVTPEYIKAAMAWYKEKKGSLPEGSEALIDVSC